MTNADFRHFELQRRIPVDLETIQFGVLRGLFESGEAYVAELEAHKALEKAKAAKAAERQKGGETKKKRLAGKFSSLQSW